MVVAEGEAAERITLDGGRLDSKAAGQLTPPLPAGWTETAFDDSPWNRTGLAGMAEQAYDLVTRNVCGAGLEKEMLRIGVVAVRGKFNVTDPATARLRLSLKYRGGVVVYLNGQEVARGGLPAGVLTPATPGDPYPREVYLDAKGKVLPPVDRIKKDDKDAAERIAKRNRVLGPVDLPAAALRKGPNVLAIEVHRSDYHISAAKSIRGGTGWVPCGLLDVSLSASGGGVEPNVRRPAGVQVWNQDCNDCALASDYGDPAEPLRPIVLAGARNGVFGGKVVVSSDQPIEGLKAVASELKGANGKRIIAASAVEVLYAEAGKEVPMGVKRGRWVEPLDTASPKVVAVKQGGGAVEAVWVWVRVPADAPAGDYAGTLEVSAGGKKLADVPVKLHVADWRLPEPRNLHTFAGIHQSPTALAMAYKVPEWSDKHWELVNRSLALLGQLGGQLLNIPVVDKTKLGNDDGMVTWVKKADGTFDYDYSVVERYLKTAKEHMGVPKFVVLYIYHPGAWAYDTGIKQENTVTVLDPQTGTREHLQVPEFGTEESKKFWTPVLLGLKERLAKEGMEKSLCMGSLTDCKFHPELFKMVTDILGDVQWLRIGHPSDGRVTTPERPLPGGGHIGLHFFTYLPDFPDHQRADLNLILHKDYWPRAVYYRRAQELAVGSSLISVRMSAASARLLGLPGFGHAGLDYWRINPRPGGQYPGVLWGRWPRAGGYPGDPSPSYLTWPGPNGAEPMASYQAIREGIQETEAMYVISEALEKSAAGLGADLTERCRQALRDELAGCALQDVQIFGHFFFHTNHYGWQEVSQRVFTLAGEVSAKRAN